MTNQIMVPKALVAFGNNYKLVQSKTVTDQFVFRCHVAQDYLQTIYMTSADAAKMMVLEMVLVLKVALPKALVPNMALAPERALVLTLKLVE